MSQTFPSPQNLSKPFVGHLPEWGRDPVGLLEAGALLGKVFELKLQKRTIVGYSPAWNKAILSDLETFISKGSLSGVVPYLNGGIIMEDAPEHKGRKAVLLNHFAMQPMGNYRTALRDSFAANVPLGEFDALEWANIAVMRALNAVFFSGQFSEALLFQYLAPLRKGFPAPMLPRPILFHRFNAEILRLLKRRTLEPTQDVLSHISSLPGVLEEIRVALGAAHDTTTHTLAWAIWELTHLPKFQERELLPLVIKETLRLYPPGWLGSRSVAKAVTLEGISLPKGTLVMYSPFLTHRDPTLWENPLEFKPERWKRGRIPAWGYLPFGAGERICLGMNLANVLLEEALGVLIRSKLIPLSGDPSPVSGVTLGPKGPLMLKRLG